MLGGEELDEEELETVSQVTRLRDVYNERWWSPSDEQTYFVFHNHDRKHVKAGD